MRRLILTGLLLLVAAQANALTVINSLPYTASVEGETYELAGDLTTTGSGIEVTAHDVTIDLKGYTLTFGTGDGTGAMGIYTSYGRDRLTVTTSVAGGRILHGATTYPAGCIGVFGQEVNENIIVEDVEIVINSQADATDQSSCVLLNRSIDPTVRRCILTNNSIAVANRHSIPVSGIALALDTVTPSTNVQVYDNTIVSTHLGTSITGLTASPTLPTAYDAVMYRDNHTTINQVATNAYGLRVRGPNNGTYYNNVFRTTGNGGRGMDFEHTDYNWIHYNDIRVGEEFTPESSWTNALRLRYGTRFSVVENNTSTALCGGPYESGRAFYLTAVANVDQSNLLDEGNIIRDNTFTAESSDPTKSCWAMVFGSMQTGHDTTVTGNDIVSNNVAIMVRPDALNEPTRDLILSDNKVTKVEDVGYEFYSYAAITDGSVSKDVLGMNISNDEYCGGASRTDVLDQGTGTFDYAYEGAAIPCGQEPTPTPPTYQGTSYTGTTGRTNFTGAGTVRFQ